MRARHRGLIGVMTTAILLGVCGFSRGWFKSEETTVTEIAPGVWFRKLQWEPTFLGCNQGWVIFKDFVLVIDANFPNQAEAIIPLIRKTTDKPIRFVFDTHYHGDHASGNPVYSKIGATVISSESAIQEFEKAKRNVEPAKAAAGGQREPDDQTPTLRFPRTLVFDDGLQRVELLHFAHGHTKGDAVAWLPRQGILFTGDACVNGAFNALNDSNTESWIGVLTELRRLPVKTICPGHGEAGDITLIDTQRRFFVELREFVGTALAGRKSLADIKDTIDFPWYKQWTGVTVGTQTKQIEHVFRELGGEAE